jgi:hypothetical protein
MRSRSLHQGRGAQGMLHAELKKACPYQVDVAWLVKDTERHVPRSWSTQNSMRRFQMQGDTQVVARQPQQYATSTHP